MQKETAPEVYRRYLWENIRDNVDDVSSFWHLESMAGGDGLDPYDSNKGINRTDYGAIYVDFNFGQVLSSRRMEAYLQGLYDFKIVKLCRLYLKKYPNKTLENKLTSIIIPNSTISIGKGTFADCTSLISITIPNSITKIGAEAFYNCYHLNSVNISNIVTWCNIDFQDASSNPLSYAKKLYLNEKLDENEENEIV